MLNQQLSRAAERVIGIRGKKLIKYGLLRARTALGREPFTSYTGIDRALLKYLPSRPGFFVEAGANDGFTSSNTYYLEKAKGWSGILVEAVPQLANMARWARSAPVIHAALGPPDKAGTMLSLNFNDLESRVAGKPKNCRWAGLFGRNPSLILAPVRTLSDILDDVGAPEVDLLSLDVEGYDVEALSGLDLSKCAPKLIVIETTRLDQVRAFLGAGYDLLGEIAHGDYLFSRR